VSCYEEVVAEMNGTVVSSGALIKADPSQQAGGGSTCAFLLEEYLDGPEVRFDPLRVMRSLSKIL
jgi:hypothetical protein